MTRVYIARVDCLFESELFSALLQRVPKWRRERIERQKNESEKRLSLGAWALLTEALRRNGEDAPRFAFGENGKPFLENNGDLFFNLSHSGNTVMCAVSSRPVGCDTEAVRPRSLEVARRFFAHAELSFIERGRTDEERLASFYRIWTLKESFVKATGYGMSLPFESFSVVGENGEVSERLSCEGEDYSLFEYDLSDGYRYAVSAQCSDAPAVEEISLREL